MLNKDSFITIINLLKDSYKKDIDIYNALEKFNIYLTEENDLIYVYLEKLIYENYSDFYSQLILDYCYSQQSTISLTENDNEIIIDSAEKLWEIVGNNWTPISFLPEKSIQVLTKDVDDNYEIAKFDFESKTWDNSKIIPVYWRYIYD